MERVSWQVFVFEADISESRIDRSTSQLSYVFRYKSIFLGSKRELHLQLVLYYRLPTFLVIIVQVSLLYF